MNAWRIPAVLAGVLAFTLAGDVYAQNIRNRAQDRWITATDAAPGVTLKSRDQATNLALRKAVEQAVGVFLTGQTRTGNYQTIYDKVFADAVGYVKEYKVIKSWLQDGSTYVKVRALVSTQKFEKNWAVIAHTYRQENSPRVMMIISEATYGMLKTRQSTDRTSEIKTVKIKGKRYEIERGASVVDTRSGAIVVDDRGRWWRRPRVVTAAGRSTTLGAGVRDLAATVEVSGRTGSDRKDTRSEEEYRVFTLSECGAVQTTLEGFFLSKGIKLVDRGSVLQTAQRDLRLAVNSNDVAKIAAIGARFKADIVILGSAAAKYAKSIEVAQTPIHQFNAKLVVRAIRCDTGQLIVAETYGPTVSNSLQKAGGEDKALAKLAKVAAPKLLSATVEAWRKQVQVARDLRLTITGMDYEAYKLMQEELRELRPVQAMRLREITESVATIDLEHSISNEGIADLLIKLKKVKLKVTGLTSNALKLQVIK